MDKYDPARMPTWKEWTIITIFIVLCTIGVVAFHKYFGA